MSQLLQPGTILYLSLATILTGISLSFATSHVGLVGLSVPVFLCLCLNGKSCGTTAAICMIFGFFSWVTSAWWLSVGINSMNQSYWWAGYVAILVICLLGALPYGIFGIFCGKLNLLSDGNARPLLASALLSVAIELTPSPFPGSLVHGLSSAPLLLQLADLGGAPLIHFMVYAVGLSLARGLIARESVRRRRYHFLVTLVLILLTVSYGQFRMVQNGPTSDPANAISVAMVQPNIPIQGAAASLGEPGSLDTLLEQTRVLLHSSPTPDVIVWPEIPVYFSPFNSPPDQERLKNLLKGTTVPLILNADMFTNETVNNRVPYYNVVQLFRGSNSIQEEYRKMLLVPLGEYMPLEEYLTGPRFERFLSDLRRYVPGKVATVLHIRPDIAVGTPVCLEALHTNHVAKFIRAGARILVNPSNDAYFGDSAGARLNFAFSVFRAIEYRTPVVRVTNSGISAVINQLGEVVPGSMLAQFAPGSETIAVTPSTAILGTFIPRDRGILALALLSLLSLIWARVSSRASNEEESARRWLS